MLGYAGRGLQEQNDLRRLGRGLSSSDGNALFPALIIFSKYPGALLVIMEWRRRARRKMRETRRSNCWELLDFPPGKRNPAAGVSTLLAGCHKWSFYSDAELCCFFLFVFLPALLLSALLHHHWALKTRLTLVLFLQCLFIGSWLNNEALLIEMNNKLAKHLKLLHL